MKTEATITKKTFLWGMLLTGLIGINVSTMAQDQILEDADSVLNSEQLDIDGQFEKRETAADRVAKMRKKLEQKNEEMVQKKIEDIRIKEEQRLANKLQRAFNGNAMKDEVKVQQAAPKPAPIIKKVIVKVPEKKPAPKKALMKITPYAGIANFSSDDVDFESKANLGINFETMIGNYFSVGIGFNYKAMTITDTSDQYLAQDYYYGGYSYNYYYNSYYNYFGNQGREMKYKNFSLDLTGKVFATSNGKRIRPFILAGASVNKSKLKYNESESNAQDYYFGGVQYGNESYSSTYVSGIAGAGVEVFFSKNVGISLDGKYQKSFSEKSNRNNSYSSYYNADQTRLDNVGSAIQNSGIFSLNLGLAVQF